MQFTLMKFQTRAVTEILANLKRCRRDWLDDQERSGFTLSSPTGSGKTVIASTVIEALLHGSDEFGVEPDPTAVVLWVTKDPSLNEQTKGRIIQTADRMPVGSLHVIDNNFTGEKLEAGNLYFINTGKLAVTSLLVRKSNTRQTTFWEVLDNTIKDPQRTLYVILDEAHEGMKPNTKAAESDRLTLVRKLIDGDNGYAAVPIVWGISATTERFTRAMEGTGDRTMRTAVAVTAQEVQESGLLKTTLVLRHPDEKGDFTTTLVREATIELASVTDRWSDYCDAEQISPAVRPLMVVQIPNRENDNSVDEDKTIRMILDVISSHLPGFDERQVGHVLGDRELVEVGGYRIPKVAPESVQDDRDLRILIAKDAVSTGWDCPRAEVLVSLRPGRDRTYITQLLGRMVRTPLARTTSDDILNSASAYLPLFDLAAASAVADDIMGKGSGGGTAGPKVLIDPIDLTWNSNVPEDLAGLLRSLPSLPKPAPAQRPIKRMLEMAAALAFDGLVETPNESSTARLCNVIDGIITEFRTAVDELAQRIRTAELRQLTVELGTGETADRRFSTGADERTVEDALRYARRAFTPAIANAWLRAKYTEATTADIEADLVSLQAQLAAVPLLDLPVKGAVDRLEDAAEDQVSGWFDEIRRELPRLTESRRAVYDRIRSQAREPQEVGVQLPKALRVDSVDSNRVKLPTFDKHLLASANGKVPIAKATSWEIEVLNREVNAAHTVGWYRNPSSGNAALQIAYVGGDGKWHSVQPDFLIFEENSDGSLGVSIVDPHSPHLGDAIPKLRALAGYAEKYAARFNRIDAVGKTTQDGPLRVLELHHAKVRAAVMAADDARALFDSAVAGTY